MQAPSFSARLTGVQFVPKTTKEYLDGLPLGTKFEMRREPNNEYDMNAVGVWHAGYYLGHIDRETVRDLAWWLDQGHAYECVLTSLDEGKARKHYLHITPGAAGE